MGKVSAIQTSHRLRMGREKPPVEENKGAVSLLSAGRGQETEQVKAMARDFPGGPVGKNPTADAGDVGSIPGLGRWHVLRGN